MATTAGGTRALQWGRILLLLLSLGLPLDAPGGDGKGRGPGKENAVTTNDHASTFLINNLFNYYSNNGAGSYNLFTGNGGLEYPKDVLNLGGPKTVVYEDGVVWGGFHMGRTDPKVGGSQYWHALQAGRILVPGTPRPAGEYTPNCVADDPALPKYRIYRVRPDIRPGTSFEVVAERLEEEAALISRYEPSVTASSLFGEYIRDWNEWPARGSATDSLGLAPFFDFNGNGRYDPPFETPGQPGADQTLYYVANDCDPYRVQSLKGSPPIGIEMHRTIWGYAGRGLDNVIFQSTLLINKSGTPVDSMFIGQWMDSDVGDANDDSFGCDTLLGLTYTYNRGPRDATYGYTTPAAGVTLLGGPTIPGTGADSAIVRLRYRAGLRNLTMTSVSPHGSTYYWGDPAAGTGGDTQLYRMLNGRTAYNEPFTDSTTMLVTKFPFTGDPVRETGYFNHAPGHDWRMLASSGPFTFSAGDTQEVVTATIVGQGPDRLSSVTALKEGTAEVRRLYRNLLIGPAAAATVSYPSATAATVSILVDGRRTALETAKAILRRRDGTQVVEIPLADDGAHGDSEADDQVFRGSVQIPVEAMPLSGDVEGANGVGGSLRYPYSVQSITVAGPVTAAGPFIFSDNLNDNKKADLYENVCYGITLTNGSTFPLRGVRFHSLGQGVREIPQFGAGAEYTLQYNPAEPASAYSVDIFAQPGSVQPIPVSISDSLGNRWIDTLQMPFLPNRYFPSGLRAVHIAGQADGDFDVMVVDRHAVKDRSYRIRAFDADSAGLLPTITVEDSADGRIVLEKHPLPDPRGHTVPVTEGFKVLRGSVGAPGERTAFVSIASGPWTWAGGAGGLLLEAYNGTIGSGVRSWPAGGVWYDRLRDLEIRFVSADTLWRISTPTDTNISYAHRYLASAEQPPAQSAFAPFIVSANPGYAYQDYVWNLPFAAYDVNASPPRRLMVGYLENNVPAGLVDGRYYPPAGSVVLPSMISNVDSLGPREWFFIFDLPYGESPAPSLQVDLLHTRTPLMWFGTPARYPGRAITGGRTMKIFVPKSPGTGDIWSFNPVEILGGIDKTIPDQMQLFPNYPNPFNGGTTIKYGLPADSRVTLRIYNILGQEVRTLVDEVQFEGYRTATWDGRNNTGTPVATGVYIYRMQGVTTEESPREFTSAQKMIVIR